MDEGDLSMADYRGSAASIGSADGNITEQLSARGDVGKSLLSIVLVYCMYRSEPELIEMG